MTKVGSPLQKLGRRDDPKQKARTRRRQIERHDLGSIASDGRRDGGSVSEEIVGTGRGADDEVEGRGGEVGHGEGRASGGDGQSAEGFFLHCSFWLPCRGRGRGRRGIFVVCLRLFGLFGLLRVFVFVFVFVAICLAIFFAIWLAIQMKDHRAGPLVDQDPPLRNARPGANPLVGGVVDGFQVEVREDRGGGAGPDADGAGFQAFACRHGEARG